MTASDWRMSAACRDVPPESFFPVAVPGTGAYAAQAAEALRACGACPVSRPCGDFAESARIEWGIWGGKGPSERGAVRGSLTRGAA